jgi:uncharacterized repeat protein (TIGR03803 family)
MDRNSRRELMSSSAATLVVSFLILSIPVTSQAQKEIVLHSFLGGSQDGQQPYSNVMLDGKGNLYGTATNGGLSGGGIVFRLNSSGYTVPYSFGVGSAHTPYDGLVRDSAGDLFGTLECGGLCNNGESPGAVFELTSSGVETVIASTDGPAYGNLVRDALGNLYGTSLGDSSYPAGTVFEVTSAGQYKVLHAFTGSDGYAPYAGLVEDGKGNFFGTTTQGGTDSCGCGTIFELTASGTEKVLYSFCSKVGCTDGNYPYAGVIRDAHGNLYGTTVYGGSTTCLGQFGGGCGIVFELTSAGQFIVLHSFKSSPNDGEGPNGALVLDALGNLYGTTTRGGTSGEGTVFKITPSRHETVLHSFSGGVDGAMPSASLVLDKKGNLYGTTTFGGIVNSNCSTGCGVVFKLTP